MHEDIAPLFGGRNKAAILNVRNESCLVCVPDMVSVHNSTEEDERVLICVTEKTCRPDNRSAEL